LATAQTAAPHGLETVLKFAWRRRLLVIVWQELPLILGVVLTGAALTFFFGTDIFPPFLLLLLALSGAGFALFRIRQRVLPRYRVAQIVDQRLALHDTLSTACYLLTDGHD